MLESPAHGQKSDFTGREHRRGRRAAGRQIDFAPLRDHCGAGGGKSEIANYASAADCQQHARVLAAAGRRNRSERPAQCASRARDSNGLRRSRASRSTRKIPARRCGCSRACWRGSRFTSTMTGDESLRRRPMRRVIEPLRQMGAEIRSQEGDRAPLEIRGGRVARDRLHAADSQRAGEVRGAAGGALCRRRDHRARIGVTRDHTEVALREFGATIDGSAERDSHSSAAET